MSITRYYYIFYPVKGTGKDLVKLLKKNRLGDYGDIRFYDSSDSFDLVVLPAYLDADESLASGSDLDRYFRGGEFLSRRFWYPMTRTRTSPNF